MDIFHATLAVNTPICEWMYVRYVRDNHGPTRMMVLSEALLSFMAIVPLAQRLCDNMQLRV